MSRKPSSTPTKTKPDRDSSSNLGGIATFFEFERLGTNFRTEVLAGVTTFVTMAYILAVNPDILSSAIFLQESGDLFGELVFATAISSAIATFVMGVYAKYPFALAPGMGINAYFAFSVVLGLGIDWRVALAAVFIEGLIFIAMSVSKMRSRIVAAIPDCLKHATAAGIGLFIPLSFSIAEGLAVGFISYPILKFFQGKANKIDLTVWILAAVFLLRFVFLALEIGA